MVPFYEEFVTHAKNDADVEAERGRAFLSLASLRSEIGEREQALSDVEEMQAIFARLTVDFPTVPAYRKDLASSHHNLGVLLRDLGKRGEAEAAYRDALKI